MATNVNDILNDLCALADDESDVSLGDVIEKIGPRGKGALLLMPGLMGVTPVGAIPGVPTVLGLFTVVIAVQLLLGRDHLWLPGFLRSRAVDDDDLSEAVGKLRGPADWVDRYFGNRLGALTAAPSRVAAALLSIVLGAILPPLEAVPFAALNPCAAIAQLNARKAAGAVRNRETPRPATAQARISGTATAAKTRAAAVAAPGA